MAIDFNEADTCRRFVTPQLIGAGWESHPASLTEQYRITDGRIDADGERTVRGKQKKADYLLRYDDDFMIAVVEAKRYGLPVAQGLQQAKDYAERLGLKFAYSMNGREIIEFDYLTGQQRLLDEFPKPDELWTRLSVAQSISVKTAEHLLEPYYKELASSPRYYQEIAINRAVQAIAQGQRRVLLTMATGTGKTLVAFQICWKLWNSGWNKRGTSQRPRILFLADRNILVDDPKDKTFAPFADARFKIERGHISKGREMYFAIYQAIASSENKEGLYKQFSRDFFDLIVIDECHRGSAHDESNWREILTYFEPAYQLGMTATPLQEENRNTYDYFGNPVYQYSLKQGIDDGFLAPYTILRVVTDVDAKGWRPTQGQRDRYGYLIPDQEYTTQDYERIIALKMRTDALARHLTNFLEKSNNRFAKTIVFCVDQEHALAMQDAIARYSAAWMQDYPDYVCRITSDEGDIGQGLLYKFKDVEKLSPVIVTTSKLLTTGVDVPTCRNVVIARVIKSMTEFKQIIGRGTRVRDDYGKLFFNIIDYTGSATQLFADPDFDGEPVSVTEEQINDKGDVESGTEAPTPAPNLGTARRGDDPKRHDQETTPRIYYVDDVRVEISAEWAYKLSEAGDRVAVRFTDYTAEQVRTLYPDATTLRQQWADPQSRVAMLESLAERGVESEKLMSILGERDADLFDVLCHLAFNAPIRTRQERADRVRLEETAYFEQYTSVARDVLSALLDKYTDHGAIQFSVDLLKVPPLSNYGNVSEIARFFGGAEKLKAAFKDLQTLLYAA